MQAEEKQPVQAKISIEEGRGKAKITQKKGSSVHARYKLKGRQRKSTDKRRNRLMLHVIAKSKKSSEKGSIKAYCRRVATWHKIRRDKRQR